MNIGVIGATGLTGKKLVEILEPEDIDIENLYLFASSRSAGEKIYFRGEEFAIEELTEESLLSKAIDVVFIASGNDIAKKYAPLLSEKGCYVLDKSSAFRLEDNVPLIVPEINFDILKREDRIIANPNCTTIPIAIAISALLKEFDVKKIFAATYQSVSGAGKEALADYDSEINDIASGKNPISSYFDFPIVGNLIPQIDDFYYEGDFSNFTREEVKLVLELKKILKNKDIFIDTINIRVPVRICHSSAVFVETEQKCEIEKIVDCFKSSSDITILDDPVNKLYPMPYYLENTDGTYIGRIKQAPGSDRNFSFWVVADNLRRGASYNAMVILKKLIKRGWIEKRI